MKVMPAKICHFTSAHEGTDDRIFLKEAKSLRDAGYDVCIVAKGNDDMVDGVRIFGCGSADGRFDRMARFAKTVYKCARSLDCDVYHFHDPELLPYGLRLKKAGKKVIFDSHEDVPAQIRDKKWIPAPLRKMTSSAYRAYETRAVKELDAIVAATPHIAEQFEGRAREVVVVNNYPMLDDIVFHDTPFGEREAIVCYVGGIDELRGEKIMIEAMKDVDGILVIAGDHEIMQVDGGARFVGRLDRNGVNQLYGSAIVGLCILKPIENYYYSQPIKMYEYMAAGIPFICSDFPGWRQLVNDSRAGICVDPADNEQIAEAIQKLLDDRDLAQDMGRRGYEYVLNKCTWSREAEKLKDLYSELTGTKRYI